MADQHPIKENPALPIEARLRILEAHLAQAWDQLWWLSLSAEQRQRYEVDGHRAPITEFYHEE